MNLVSELLASPAFLSNLAIYAVKTMVLIAMAALGTLLLRRSAAALRYGVWAAAFGAAIVLIPLSFGLPEVRLGLIDRGEVMEAMPVATAPKPNDAAAGIPAPFEAEVPATSGFSGDVVSFAEVARSVTATEALLLTWLFGMIAVGLYYLIGMIGAMVRVRRASAVTEPEWVALADEIAWRLSVRSVVQLRWHPGSISPMAWGYRRPVILLPAEAKAWTEERRSLVLMHEMAHITRRDCLVQAVVQVVCAVHWFNPVVWWGASRMRSERERACDDYVLSQGAKASTYAQHLLEIARAARERTVFPVSGVAMARHSELEGRLMAILAPKGTPRMARMRSHLMTAMLFASASVLLAAMSPWETSHELESEVLSGVVDEEFGLSENILEEEATNLNAIAYLRGDTIRHTFDVRDGGTLTLDADMGSIAVQSARGNRVEVEVQRRARGQNRSEDLQVTIDERNGDVRVVARLSEEAGRRRNQQISATYRITVPERYNVTLKTKGGSISVGALSGRVEAETAGGSLSFGRIDGSVRGMTAGGSITLAEALQAATLRTSGGSISVGTAHGDLDVRTSGGSITIREARGNVTGETSGGSIRAQLTGRLTRDASLTTSGGSIDVQLGRNTGVDLDAEASAGRVRSNFAEQPRDSNARRLRAAVNGGGPVLRLRTSAGNIDVRNEDGGRTSGVQTVPAPGAPGAPGASSVGVSVAADNLGAMIEQVVASAMAGVAVAIETGEFAAAVGHSAEAGAVRGIEAAVMQLQARSPNQREAVLGLLEALQEMEATSGRMALQRIATTHSEERIRKVAECLGTGRTDCDF
jgi:beta-lactamase regulating signal transducer with metallopeptidase domain/DUF4097 and DUF4098 domain-containing protein YvlB